MGNTKVVPLSSKAARSATKRKGKQLGKAKSLPVVAHGKFQLPVPKPAAEKSKHAMPEKRRAFMDAQMQILMREDVLHKLSRALASGLARSGVNHSLEDKHRQTQRYGTANTSSEEVADLFIQLRDSTIQGLGSILCSIMLHHRKLCFFPLH